MSDPLSEVIALLRPRTVFTKGISGAGRWAVRYSDYGEPSFCTVLEGSCRLAVDGQRELILQSGDFVLLPATPGFTMSGFDPVAPKRIDPNLTPASAHEVRHGTPDGPPDVRLLGGYFVSPRSCASSARNQTNRGQAATSCLPAWSRYCSSKRSAQRRPKTRPPDYCAA